MKGLYLNSSDFEEEVIGIFKCELGCSISEVQKFSERYFYGNSVDIVFEEIEEYKFQVGNISY